MEVQKSILFLSDFHLGAPNYEQSIIRERKIVDFLHSKMDNISELFLVGDLFDFWFEYNKVVPKYYIRFLGILSIIADKGIPIHIFSGNHDLWMKDYFQKELGAKVYHHPIEIERNGKKFYIAHGDGLGPGDHGYKFLKKIFRNKICQSLFHFIHPDIGIGIANYFSKSSRAKTGKSDSVFLGKDKEWLILYSEELLKTKDYDFLIYGHRHLPLMLELSKGAEYVNLGDWIQYFSYGEFKGTEFELKNL